MTKNAPTTSTIGRYLRASTPGQRRAAYAAALLLIVLLVAAIAFVAVSGTDILSPDPANVAEQQYLRAREAEQQGIATATATGQDIDTFPAVITARLSIAQAQLEMGQTTLAARLADSIVQANPDNVRALILQGNVYEVAGNNDRALTAYRTALDLTQEGEPELQREALRGIGHNLAALGDNAQALGMLEQAALIPPESITLHLAAAEIALGLERWQDAAHHYYSVLMFDPENDIAREQLQMLERDHSRATQAAQDMLTNRMRQNIPDNTTTEADHD